MVIKDSSIYAGTFADSGGVFHSLNNGRSWTLTNLRGRQVYCLAMHDSILLAGGPAGPSYSGGLFISTDGGQSWTQSINRGVLGINSVAIGDTNLFATDLNNQGIFVSTNRGESWSSQLGGSSIAVMGTSIFVGAFYNSIGFFSRDNGKTWTETMTPGDIFSVLVNNDTIFAATDHGIFASADSGFTWANIGSGLNSAWFYSLTISNGFLYAGSAAGQVWQRPLSGILINVLRAPTLLSPKNDSTVNCDSVECVWASVPGAASYRLQVALNPDFTNLLCDVYPIANTIFNFRNIARGEEYYWRVSAADSSAMSNWSFVWEFHGAVDTNRRSVKWSQTDFSASRVQALTVLDSAILVGTSSSGVFRSSDNGLTWMPLDSGLTCTNISSLATNGEDLYAGTYSDSGGVFRWVRESGKWSLTTLASRQIYTIAASGTYTLAGGPSGSDYTGGLFLSTNQGSSWTQSINRGSSGISSLVISGNDVYATDLNDQGIFVSTDHGSTWNSQYGGSCIAVMGNSIFVGAFYRDGGYRSTDNGATWSYIGNSPLPETSTLFPIGSSLIAAGEHGGVFTSYDAGLTWTEVDSGLTEAVTSFTMNRGYLFAGTANGHVWKGILSDIPTITRSGAQQVPLSYQLRQNYPNPFNPSTTVSFDLWQTSRVKLEIFNLLGQQVRIMDLGLMGAGSYADTVDMSHYASGVYFYRIEAVGVDGQQFIATKKMVLMK